MTVASIANPTVKLKPQVYIAKGSSPWYYSSDTNIYWSDEDKVINTDESISGQATVTCKDVTNMMLMFKGCSNLTSLDLSNFDTSNVTNMEGMFYNCSNIDSLDLSSFDTSKVKKMGWMFDSCFSLTKLDLSNFDTSNTISMSCMFYNCRNITSIDLSNVDTSKVKDMICMFYNCYNLTTIKGIIDMKSCEYFKQMFAYCPKLKDVKIKNAPAGFEDICDLFSDQYIIL